jgi:hypothetical protein
MTRTYGCELPPERDPLSLTDWAEAVMLVEQIDEFTEADLRGRLVEQGEGISHDEPRGRQQVEDVLREVERRARHAPNTYPFKRGDFGIELANNRLVRIYAFLLWLSLPNSPFRHEIYKNAVTPLFDYLGQAALATLFGPQVRSIRFGWPASGGRPTGPRKALVWLTDEMRVTHDSTAPVSSRLKDGGVDVVLWRPFHDGRAGFPLLLAQCTVGKREWEKKGRDIQRPLWRRYLGMGWDPPTTLVLPFCVRHPDDFETWNIMAHDVSFVIDRVRLMELLEAVELQHIPQIEEITQWTDDREQDLLLSA